MHMKQQHEEEDARVVVVSKGSSPTVWRALLFAVAAASWLAASSGIIIVNRFIIKDINFPYPITLSASGQIVSFVGAWLVCDVFKQAPPSNVDFRLFMTRIAPIGIGQGLGIWLSNKLYLYLAVSFIEMARSAMPLLTMLALWRLKLDIPTRAQLMAVLVAAFGSGISAWAHQSVVTVFGLLLLALSFAIEVARMVMLQYLLQGLNLGAWQSVKFMTLPASLTLTILIFVMEWKDMVANKADVVVMQYLPAFVLAGSLGLAVNYISSAVIQLSTATTVKLLAAVRGPIIVLAAVLLFTEKVTAMQLAGYTLAVAGFGSYQWLHARARARTGSSPRLNNTRLGAPASEGAEEKPKV